MHCVLESWSTQSKSNGQLLSLHCPISTCHATEQEMPTSSTAGALSKSLPTILLQNCLQRQRVSQKENGPCSSALCLFFYQKRQCPISLPTVFISFGAKWSLAMGCPFPQVHSTLRMKMLLLRIHTKCVMDSWGNFRIKVSHIIPSPQEIANADCRVLSANRGS